MTKLANVIPAFTRVAILNGLLVASATAHTPLFVIVDDTVTPPRLIIAPGSTPTLDGEVNLNFAPAGTYANQYVTDLPGYDATLFPFSTYPGVILQLERVYFPPEFGMYAGSGSTTEVFLEDGELMSFSGHTHYVHFSDVPDVYKPMYRYVDASGQLKASEVFTITFRGLKSGDDADGDGVLDDTDNCLVDFNPDQLDADADTVGDACDCCPEIANRDQADLNFDGECDACNCGGEPCNGGDVNYDETIDLLDIIETRNAFSPNLFPPAPADTLRCDVTEDGRIDEADLVTVRRNVAWSGGGA